MAGIRLLVFVHDFNHRIDWHVFNEPGKREQRCCSEHGRVSQIRCHSLVRDLTTDVYVVVCLLCHAFGEARGVCTRRQRDSGVGGTRATFGNQFLRATIANIEGGLKGRNQETDVKKSADASDGLKLHRRLSCSLNPIKKTTRTSLTCYFQPHICCVGARAKSVKLSPGATDFSKSSCTKCLPSFSRSVESLSK